MRGDNVRRGGTTDGSRYRRRGCVATVLCAGCFMQPTTTDRAGLFLRSYFFFRGLRFVPPVPGPISLSSVRSDLVPFGTIASTTGFLSTLRRCRRGGFSLRYSSPHWRSAVSAMFRSRPFFVSWYSYRSGRSL